MTKRNKTQATKPKRNNKRQRSGRSSLAVAVSIITVILLVVAVACYQTIYAKSSRPAQTITVDKGDSYHSLLVTRLWSDQPLASRWIARAYVALMANKPLQAGGYQIPSQASLAQVVRIFDEGAKVSQFSLRIIEGKTVKDLYQLLKNTDGVVLTVLTPPADGYAWTDVMRDNEAVAKALNIQAPNGNLEGWFAPNTYQFAKGTTDIAILERLYQIQQKILDEAWAQRADNLPYKTPYEALIMASIIEKETGIKSERNLVAAVFVNRLRQGMRLQTDPTIIYGLFDRYDGKIYRSNIAEKTEYNTYQIDGLPPTPIALPSAEAILATMHPKDSDALFFVATGKGGHKFSRTYQEHQQAVAQYRATIAKNQTGK